MINHDHYSNKNENCILILNDINEGLICLEEASFLKLNVRLVSKRCFILFLQRYSSKKILRLVIIL